MQIARRAHERKLEAQRGADAERVMLQREWSAKRRSSMGNDSYSVVSEVCMCVSMQGSAQWAMPASPL